MKNILIGILGLALCGLGVIYYLEHENVSPCGYDKEDVIQTFQDWLANGIKNTNKTEQENPITVLGINGILEYNTSPEVLGQKVYEDIKNSRICKATLIVDFTPLGKSRSIEEINVRFQKMLTSPNENGDKALYYSMAGIDVEQMLQEAIPLYKKYND